MCNLIPNTPRNCGSVPAIYGVHSVFVDRTRVATCGESSSSAGAVHVLMNILCVFGRLIGDSLHKWLQKRGVERMLKRLRQFGSFVWLYCDLRRSRNIQTPICRVSFISHAYLLWSPRSKHKYLPTYLPVANQRSGHMRGNNFWTGLATSHTICLITGRVSVERSVSEHNQSYR